MAVARVRPGAQRRRLHRRRRRRDARGRRTAWAANAGAPATLARLAAEHHFTLVHYSSEYVFDGTADAHTEDEPLSPLGVYAQTKAAGDIAVGTAPRHYLLRTSWVIGDGNNFVRTMSRWPTRASPPASSTTRSAGSPSPASSPAPPGTWSTPTRRTAPTTLERRPRHVVGRDREAVFGLCGRNGRRRDAGDHGGVRRRQARHVAAPAAQHDVAWRRSGPPASSPKTPWSPCAATSAPSPRSSKSRGPPPVVEQRATTTRSGTGGRAARSRLGSTTKTRSVETTTTRSITSPGFETGLRPSSTSGGYRWSSSEVSPVVEQRGLEPVVEQRAKRAISRDHHQRGRSPQGFETGLRPSSTSGGYRWSSSEVSNRWSSSERSERSVETTTNAVDRLTRVSRQDFVLPQPAVAPVVEQRGLDRSSSERSERSVETTQRGRSPHRVSRQDFVLPQPAVGTGGRAARSHPVDHQDAISRDHPDAVDRLTVSRQDFVLPQPAAGTGGRAARSRPGWLRVCVVPRAASAISRP